MTGAVSYEELQLNGFNRTSRGQNFDPKMKKSLYFSLLAGNSAEKS